MRGRTKAVDAVVATTERVEELNRLACGRILERPVDVGLLTRKRLKEYRRVIHAYEAAAVAVMSHLPLNHHATATGDDDVPTAG
jgi:hypothetical protein